MLVSILLAVAAPLTYRLVSEVDSAVRLRLRRELLAEPPPEARLNQHLIGRIPGAGDE